MKIGLLKNFLHYFNLRQGTILIAIFQLVITSTNFLHFRGEYEYNIIAYSL